MQEAMGKWMAGVVVAMALAGCGNEKCGQLGEHMADLALAETKAAGEAVADDKRAEIVKKTADACNAEPPKEDELDCALKAQSTKAMKKCEGVDEDEEACGKLGAHLADLALKKSLAAGSELAADAREKLAEEAKKACVADLPPAAYLDCALQANNEAAVGKCDFFKDNAKDFGKEG